jgi:hypothetical protein
VLTIVALSRCFEEETPVLLETDDQKTTTRDDPQALIEEARQLQRQRTRRRTIVLQLAGLLIILGVGINQFARGGSSAGPAPPAAAGGATQKPTVTFEKVVIRRFVPHLPVETTTIEAWSAPDGTTNRQIVRNGGGPRIEIGAAPGSDKVLGALRVDYLYDATTGTIYRAGYMLAPSQKKPTREQAFKHVLAQRYVHLSGTTSYRGRKVYILKLQDEHAHGTVYIDERTYEPMMQTEISTDLRIVVRTLAFKTLPATPANLALTTLPTMHPKARIVLHAPPRIRELYGEAAFPPGQHA